MELEGSVNIIGHSRINKLSLAVDILLGKCGIINDSHKQQIVSNSDYTKNYHVFSNIELNGFKYMYLPLKKLIESINATTNDVPINHPDAIPLIGYGVYLYEIEGKSKYINDDEELVIDNLVLQSRRRHLDIIIVNQYGSLLMQESNKIITKIECKQKELDNPIFNVVIKKYNEFPITLEFNGSKVRKYFMPSDSNINI